MGCYPGAKMDLVDLLLLVDAVLARSAVHQEEEATND